MHKRFGTGSASGVLLEFGHGVVFSTYVVLVLYCMELLCLLIFVTLVVAFSTCFVWSLVLCEVGKFRNFVCLLVSFLHDLHWLCTAKIYKVLQSLQILFCCFEMLLIRASGV